MKLIFGGQSHSIDANTLVNILIYYKNVVEEANKECGCGARDVTINVNAIEKGSFVIDLEVVQNAVEQLFSKDTLEYLDNLTEVVGFVYGAYKLFRGKPIKSDEDIDMARTTVNINVNVFNDAVKVYNCKVVREAVSKSVETANEDPNVDGFSVYGENDEPYVTINRDEFKDCIYDGFDDEVEMPTERCIDEDAVLTITSLSFVRKSRWSFIYNGFKIFITVNDDALMERIDNGDRFGKGDAIKVKLRILQRYNKEYRCYENKSYKIIEFHDHISPDKPKDLFE